MLRKLNYNYNDSSKNNGAMWEVQWAKTFWGGEQGCRKCEDQQNSLLKFYEYLWNLRILSDKNWVAKLYLCGRRVGAYPL